jgi:hypothetical protein
MQTNHPPILRFSALAAPLAVAAGAAWGTDVALAAAISAGLALTNLWAWSVLGPRLVGSLAADDGGSGLFAAALATKTLLVLGLVAWLLVSGWSPVGLALGLVPLPIGTLLAALLVRPPAAAEGA